MQDKSLFKYNNNIEYWVGTLRSTDSKSIKIVEIIRKLYYIMHMFSKKNKFIYIIINYTFVFLYVYLLTLWIHNNLLFYKYLTY